ncbi:MAG TPA: tetratricopeptide repeat protein [Gemmatimonadaceae bacterium]|nr:tetratricopeptide repeat protein [Gemmatimonadaceae bacterium]
MTRSFSVRVALLALVLAPSATLAQGRMALKRGMPTVPQRPACESSTAAPSSTADQRKAARELAQRAQQSAILGDRAAARDQLRQAAAVDPSNPDLAFQLARAHEGLGSGDAAAAEYCRFLALAPNAPEAAEARQRVAELTRSRQPTLPAQLLASFRAGITAYEARRYPQAAASFGTAIAMRPDWPDAYFDRALARAAAGQSDLAIADFEQYLRLRPEAADRAAVIARISGLRGGPLSPSAALALGLVVPGAGQMYTGRKLFGIAALAATGGAVAFALQNGTVTERYTVTTDVDPFGNPLPAYTATRQVPGRPNLTMGLVGAGALALTSAIEAFFYARHLNSRERRFAAELLPASDGVALRVTLR